MNPIVGCAIARKIAKALDEEICYSTNGVVDCWSSEGGRVMSTLSTSTVSPVEIVRRSINFMRRANAKKAR